VVAAAWATVFLAMCIGGAVVVIRSDRKRAVKAAAASTPDRSVLPPGTPVDVFVDPSVATHIAAEAVRQVGGHDINVLDDGSAVGWIGSSLTNIPNKAEYMVAVARIAQPDGSIVLACSSRPRFSSSLFGSRRSIDLTQRLVDEVTILASHQSS
jgi:hypothetical protein